MRGLRGFTERLYIVFNRLWEGLYLLRRLSKELHFLNWRNSCTCKSISTRLQSLFDKKADWYREGWLIKERWLIKGITVDLLIINKWSFSRCHMQSDCHAMSICYPGLLCRSLIWGLEGVRAVLSLLPKALQPKDWPCRLNIMKGH